MIERVRKTAAAAVMALFCAGAWGQNEIVVSQYMHNTYALNPAFAGSRGCLSVAGSFRKQWAMIENTPTSALLTVHSPLRKEKITMGVGLYTQSIHQSMNTGLTATVGYRTRLTRKTWLGLALQPGVALRSRDWSKVRTMDPQDEVFADKETGAAPLLGLGVGYYGKKFFVGVSTPTLIVCDDFEKDKPAFAPADATYILTGGYWFDINRSFALQPSVEADYSQATDAAAALTLSGIFVDRFWLMAGYRTTSDATFGLAYSPNLRLKIAYNYSLNLGPLQGYNSGSHEISIHYDFLYKVRTVGHRFY